MADQMQAIKRRMKSISSTERITSAMKLVSAAKLKQATNRYEYVKKNLGKEAELFEKVLKQEEDAPSVYTQKREGKTLYLVIAGSKGLCGSYNSSITKEVQRIAKEEKDMCCFLPLGVKAEEFCVRGNFDTLQSGYEKDEELDYEKAENLSGRIIDLYLDGSITNVSFIRTIYRNSISHDVCIEKVLPFEKVEETSGDLTGGELAFLEYDHTGNEFFHDLAKGYLTVYMYEALAEATLCEHAARRTAMKNASDSAKDMLTELSVYYNRARQSAITSEIIEIIAGAEAQRTGGGAVE